MTPLIANRNVRLRDGEAESGKKYFADNALEWLFYETETVRRVEYNDWLPTEVHFKIVCIDDSEGVFFTRKNLWNQKIQSVNWVEEGF